MTKEQAQEILEMLREALGYYRLPRWEYLIVTIKDDEKFMENLEGYGAEGWEAFNVVVAPGGSETFYFKRISRSLLKEVGDLQSYVQMRDGSVYTGKEADEIMDNNKGERRKENIPYSGRSKRSSDG